MTEELIRPEDIPGFDELKNTRSDLLRTSSQSPEVGREDFQKSIVAASKILKDTVDFQPMEQQIVFSIINKEESISVLNNSKIDADPYKGSMLTIKDIEAAGLSPQYEITVGDVKYHLSHPYKNNHRLAVTGYVTNGKRETKVQTFYLSGSQGVWRSLPDYTEKNHWYGKGYGEESLILPIPIQKVLGTVSGSGLIIDVNDPNKFFLGTAKHYHEDNAKEKKLDYYQQVEDRPVTTLSNSALNFGRLKTNPENLKIENEELAPNFSKPLDTWKQNSDIYKEISVEVFPSKDGSLKYMFCKDVSGRAWIGGVENNSEITDIGLRKSWVDSGDLVAPAYEYNIMCGEYGNQELSKDKYVDLFETYLRKIPVIQEYIIQSSKTIDELIKNINQIGDIKGSNGQIIDKAKLIDDIKNGQDPRYFTRTYGIREKIISLSNKQ